MEKVAWHNLPNCLKLSNGDAELIVTTDIGPRIVHYALAKGENILGGSPGVLDKPNQWQLWAGHRIWIAPEHPVRSYGPDNGPIGHMPEGPRGVKLMQPVEPTTHVQKELVVTLDERGPGVTVEHRLTNRGTTPTQLATWGLTIMNGNGTAILPHEPFKRHEDEFLPARPLVLWHYTDLSDPRWQHGPRFLRLTGDASKSTPQKVGIMNKVGWAAYARQGLLFVKRIPYDPTAAYTDHGSNTEVYTEAELLRGREPRPAGDARAGTDRDPQGALVPVRGRDDPEGRRRAREDAGADHREDDGLTPAAPLRRGRRILRCRVARARLSRRAADGDEHERPTTSRATTSGRRSRHCAWSRSQERCPGSSGSRRVRGRASTCIVSHDAACGTAAGEHRRVPTTNALASGGDRPSRRDRVGAPPRRIDRTPRPPAADCQLLSRPHRREAAMMSGITAVNMPRAGQTPVALSREGTLQIVTTPDFDQPQGEYPDDEDWRRRAWSCDRLQPGC